LHVWDPATGEMLARLEGHRMGVSALAVDGDRLFSSSRDLRIRVWALGTWELLRTVVQARTSFRAACVWPPGGS
jgi:WD40 repeat protein